MSIKTVHRQLKTRGECDTHDITPIVSRIVSESGLSQGTATIFVNGSTAGVTTIEYEPGVVHDLADAYERAVPRDIPYKHEEAWHDGNGHSHVRAAMLGPSLVVPFEHTELQLGTWQQVVLIDFDNRPRERRFTVTLMGE